MSHLQERCETVGGEFIRPGHYRFLSVWLSGVFY